MGNKKGEVVHSRKTVGEGAERQQIDTLTVGIPLAAIEDSGIKKLVYWWVEEFENAYIDWNTEKIVLIYRHESYLPSGYESEPDSED